MKASCVLKTAGMMILFFIGFSTVFVITGTACMYLAKWVSDTFFGPDQIQIIMLLGLLFIIIAMSFEFAIGMCYFNEKEKKERKKEPGNSP
jgi:hypothetical protein